MSAKETASKEILLYVSTLVTPSISFSPYLFPSLSLHLSLSLSPAQKQEDTLRQLKEKMDAEQREREREIRNLKQQASELCHCVEREKRRRKELEVCGRINTRVRERASQ